MKHLSAVFFSILLFRVNGLLALKKDPEAIHVS
jgi:hypothetical protein